MKLTRRDMLATGAAALAWPRSGLAATQVLRAAPATAQIAPAEFGETPVWAFEGSAPGPVLRARQGSRLVRRVENGLPQPTAVHWHGIRIDNAMDGVPGLTQEVIAPGAAFDYDFALPDAGTYWYHSHNRSMEQVARGLHGALIVDEAEGAPEVDGEHIWLLDDWRLNPDTIAIEDNFGAPFDLSHAGRIGNIVTTSGKFEREETVKAGARLRLRLINVAGARVFDLGLKGLRGWIVALDGMPLATPREVERFTLAPAQRADLIVDVTARGGEDAHLLRYERGEGISQVWMNVEGNGRPRDAAPAALPANPLSDVAPREGATPVTLMMTGGAMRGMPDGAMHEGEMKDMRALAGAGMFWALNGQAGRSDTPLFTAARGEVIHMALGNDTGFPHAMHLHGHHFHELDADGTPGDFRDTTLVAPGEIRQIVFRAHNPGKWLIHCHMLSHASAGMTSWYEVA